MNATRPKIKDVQVTFTFNGEEVYQASTEPFRSVSSWIHSMQTSEDGVISLVIWDPENNSNLINKILTPGDICQAFAHLVKNGWNHCSRYPLSDLENADACTSDLVLQQACYGDVIWG